MLATLTEELPRGDGWQFEPKWDGYRALAYVRAGEVKLVSRRGNDLTQRFAIGALPTLVVVEGKTVRGRLERPRGCRDIEGFLAPWLN